MRSFYVNVRLSGPLTQGSIINHCLAKEYSGQVWGLIVTPRCDLAHDNKVSNVHYLPIVNLSDFMKVDGLDYLFRKWCEKRYRKFEDLCSKYKFPIKGMTEEHYKKMANEKIQKAGERDKFLQCLKNYHSCNIENEEFRNSIEKSKLTLLDNLIEDKIPSYYLIEDWNSQKNAKVILLRELKRISYATAKKLGCGLEKGSINEDDELNFKIEETDLYHICAQVRSPFIEHIMQRFSYNFCRVGVEDRNRLDMGL